MIIVHVEHFLDQAGRDYFPKWIEEAATVMQLIAGFIAIRRIILINEPTACHVLLTFESLDLLKQWSASYEHHTLVALLDPYRLQPYKSQTFEAETEYKKLDVLR